MQLGHVHIKTREDPRKVAQFYIDNFGATVKREIPGRGCQLDLHGVQLNVMTIIADQKHEQHVGIEHSAIKTDAELIAVIKDDADPRILPNPPSSIRLAVLRFFAERGWAVWDSAISTKL
jgi:hypothetical protein